MKNIIWSGMADTHHQIICHIRVRGCKKEAESTRPGQTIFDLVLIGCNKCTLVVEMYVYYTKQDHRIFLAPASYLKSGYMSYTYCTVLYDRWTYANIRTKVRMSENMGVTYQTYLSPQATARGFAHVNICQSRSYAWKSTRVTKVKILLRMEKMQEKITL